MRVCRICEAFGSPFPFGFVLIFVFRNFPSIFALLADDNPKTWPTGSGVVTNELRGLEVDLVRAMRMGPTLRSDHHAHECDAVGKSFWSTFVLHSIADFEKCSGQLRRC